MATLPKAVQRQLDAADALLAGTNQPVAPATPQPSPLADPAPVEPKPVEPQVQEPAQPTPKPVTEDTWEHRYKSLQGIFNQKVPELQSQNRELAAKLQTFAEKLETLEKQQTPAQPQAPVLDPKDVSEFGQDLVEMVQRQTQAVLGSVVGRVDQVVATFEQRLTKLEQALKGTEATVTMTAEEVFFTKLTALVPDWEQINTNDKFLAWLSEVDPVYGAPRQAALEAAQSRSDVVRVANVFKAFKAQAPQPPKQDALERQVSPSAAASSAPPAPAEKPILSAKQVEVFYHDVATGKYRGRLDEMTRLEQMINEAMAEGRIR